MREGARLDRTAAGFIRGGNWNNGANDGAFTLNLNNAPSNTNTNIGFRCSRYASYTSRPEQKLYGVSSAPLKHTDALRLADGNSRENIKPVPPRRTGTRHYRGTFASGGVGLCLDMKNEN